MKIVKIWIKRNWFSGTR